MAENVIRLVALGRNYEQPGIRQSYSYGAHFSGGPEGTPRYRDAEESDVFILAGAEDLVPVLRKDPDGAWVAKHPGYCWDATGWVYDSNGNPVVYEDVINGYRVRQYPPRIEGLFARIERWTNLTTPPMCIGVAPHATTCHVSPDAALIVAHAFHGTRSLCQVSHHESSHDEIKFHSSG